METRTPAVTATFQNRPKPAPGPREMKSTGQKEDPGKVLWGGRFGIKIPNYLFNDASSSPWRWPACPGIRDAAAKHSWVGWRAGDHKISRSLLTLRVCDYLLFYRVTILSRESRCYLLPSVTSGVLTLWQSQTSCISLRELLAHGPRIGSLQLRNALSTGLGAGHPTSGWDSSF